MNTEVCAMNISTKEMFQNFWDCMKDNFWTNGGFHDESIDFIKIASGLVNGSRTTIRQAFADGYTTFFLGDKMKELEEMSEKEIRVYHDDKLVCVLVDSEISY